MIYIHIYMLGFYLYNWYLVIRRQPPVSSNMARWDIRDLNGSGKRCKLGLTHCHV